MLFYRISVVLIIIPIVFSVRYNEFDRDKRKILPERVQVQTDYGRIEGWNVDLGWTKQKYKHVHLFFGIPYAKPPFTELRFKVIIAFCLTKQGSEIPTQAPSKWASRVEPEASVSSRSCNLIDWDECWMLIMMSHLRHYSGGQRSHHCRWTQLVKFISVFICLYVLSFDFSHPSAQTTGTVYLMPHISVPPVRSILATWSLFWRGLTSVRIVFI